MGGLRAEPDGHLGGDRFEPATLRDLSHPASTGTSNEDMQARLTHVQQ